MYIYIAICVQSSAYATKGYCLNLNEIRIHMHSLARPMSIAKNRSSVRVVSCKLANCWVLSGHHDPIMLRCKADWNSRMWHNDIHDIYIYIWRKNVCVCTSQSGITA